MTFDIEREIPPAALVDSEQVGAIAHVAPRRVREHFNALGCPPAASYRGRLLWLAADVHKVVA